MGQTVEVGMIVFPADRAIQAEGSLESVGDGVLVSGLCKATGDAQCARCLTDFPYPVSSDFMQLFVYPEHEADYADSEDDIGLIKDDSIDLEPLIRDSLILDLPLATLCRPDCLGLCPRCGANLNDDPDHQHTDDIDSRWSALKDYLK